MKTFRIIAGLGLLVLIFASPMPWLTVNFLGAPSDNQLDFILFDMYNIVFRGSKIIFPETNVGVFFSTIVQSISTMTMMLAAALLYSLSIVLGALSIAYRKVSLFAGAMSTMTGLLWILGIDSFRSTLIQEANKPGGIFEPLLSKGISSIILVGYGVYVVLLVGVIFFIAFFFESRVFKGTLLTASLREMRTEVKAANDRCNRLNAVIQSIEEKNLKIMKDYNDLRKEHDGVVSTMLRCRVENSYTVGDRLFASIRNTGSLPVTWIEVMDIEPRPKGANLPSGQIQLLGGINPGAAIKFTYDLKDIYNKPIVFDPEETYTVKVTVGWGQAAQVYDLLFKLLGGSQFKAEIEGEYTTGNSLVMNIKNVGFSRITQQRITSITPPPGGPAPTAQKVIVNPGETKTLWFTWTEGAFIQGISYTVGLEISDGTNSYSLSFVVLAS